MNFYLVLISQETAFLSILVLSSNVLTESLGFHRLVSHGLVTRPLSRDMPVKTERMGQNIQRLNQFLER